MAFSSTTNRKLTTVSILVAIFLSAMEATVVATVMPTVVGDLGGIELYGWVGSVYLLGSTVITPICGRLCDRYGRKPLMLLSTALFVAGSMACGAAGSMHALIAYRVIQALGAGGMQTIAFTVMGDIFTAQERARIQGVFGAVWGLAAVSGPFLAALLVKVASWRWVFFVNVPVGALAAGLFAYAFHESVERHAESADLVSLLRRRVMVVSSVLVTLVGAIMASVLVYLPLYMQGVRGATATASGSVLAPMLLGWPIASVLAGRLLRRVTYRALLAIGCGLAVLSAIALSQLHSGSMALVTFFFGVGLGLVNTALILATQESCAWNERGTAIACGAFCRTIGGAIAVGAFGSMLAGSLEGPLVVIFHALVGLAMLALAASFFFPVMRLGQPEPSARPRVAA